MVVKITLPNRVTKYFKSEDRHYYQSGSLKLGTLEEYGRLENAEEMKARLDPQEGIWKRRFDVDIVEPGPVKIPGISIGTGVGHVVVNNLMSEVSFNDWVFCVCAGEFSEQQHKHMREGDANSGYAGDAQLTDWVTFDTKRLIETLKRCLSSHAEFGVQGDHAWLIPRMVQYDKSVSQNCVVGNNIGFKAKNHMTEDDYNRVVFRKAPEFRVEKEVRILARMKAPQCADMDAKPVYVSSKEFVDAVVARSWS